MKLEKFTNLLTQGNIVDLTLLRKLCWNGIPDHFRATCWLLLLVSLNNYNNNNNNDLGCCSRFK